MTYERTLALWKQDAFFSEEMHRELAQITDEKELQDRFYRELSFGTGGLRGKMGAGTNRMNQYTVGKAAAGLASFLLERYGAELCAEKGVVIGFDTRYNSRFFADITACVLTSMGVCARVFTEARPTPQLSFGVSYLHALAGVVITASHNPKEYNGFKIYDETGCQMVPSQAEQVAAHIRGITDVRAVCFEGNAALTEQVDVTEAFVEAVLKQSRLEQNHDGKRRLKIVYTPLHGTGQVPVMKALREAGFRQVELVSAQADGDGSFPTVLSPNPEEHSALDMALAQAKRTGAHLVLGTDPDCDRIGVGVRFGEEFVLLTGNQTGALLTDFLISHTDLSSMKRPAVVKTVVTSELGANIAQNKGISVFTTLTGFKYIGEKISQFERAARENRPEQRYDFLFGYEESYGYLCGTHARDKDAVVSALLICEMAAWYLTEGKNPMDGLENLYETYGYYYDTLDSFTLPGKDGADTIQRLMEDLRRGAIVMDDEAQVKDYSVPVSAEEGFGNLPAENLLKYQFSDGSWMAVRPSGTEPKLKFYYSIRGNTRQEAQRRCEQLQMQMKSFVAE